MARAINAAAESLPVHEPQRQGKYDRWLDGRLWEVRVADAPWADGHGADAAARQRFLRRAMRGRARARGLRVRFQVLEDGTLAVRAERRRP